MTCGDCGHAADKRAFSDGRGGHECPRCCSTRVRFEGPCPACRDAPPVDFKSTSKRLAWWRRRVRDSVVRVRGVAQDHP
jgi:hypothetical protein